MPSTDRKLELQAKDIDVSTVSQPAVCLPTWRARPSDRRLCVQMVKEMCSSIGRKTLWEWWNGELLVNGGSASSHTTKSVQRVGGSWECILTPPSLSRGLVNQNIVSSQTISSVQRFG